MICGWGTLLEGWIGRLLGFRWESSALFLAKHRVLGSFSMAALGVFLLDVTAGLEVLWQGVCLISALTWAVGAPADAWLGLLIMAT